jgi:hypothetical protein
MEENKKEKLVYEATKAYVEDQHPTLATIFEEIWDLANSNHDNQKDKQKTIGKASFLSDTTIQIIVQIVVPFFSGVFSAILASTIDQKIKDRKKKATVEIKVGVNKMRIEVDIDNKMAKKLVPYAKKQIEKDIASGKISLDKMGKFIVN